MNDFELLVKLHERTERQGPGGEAETNLAIHLSGLKKKNNLKIADIGCGSGASTLALAKQLDASITAVDLFSQFLDNLQRKVNEYNLQNKVQTLCCSMDNLPFEKESYDAIWSEGAIYNMGFKKGIKYWQRFIKPKGILAISELTWLTTKRPSKLDIYWQKNYSQVDIASAKINILENNGFRLLGYFPLPAHCWIDNYYTSLENQFASFLIQYKDNQMAYKLIKAEREEIDFYKSHKDYYSYGFYIAQKVSP